MNGRLTYYPDFMDSISENYQSCANKVQEAIDELDNAKTTFLINYEGQGVEIAESVFEKISEHLGFLRSCLDQTGQYVTYAKETMQAQDDATKAQIEGS